MKTNPQRPMLPQANQLSRNRQTRAVMTMSLAKQNDRAHVGSVLPHRFASDSKLLPTEAQKNRIPHQQDPVLLSRALIEKSG
jgi:hypothetical protein